VVLLVVVRLFTEKVPVLPGAANFVDVPLMFVLLVAAVIRSPIPRNSPFFFPAALFLAVCALSTVANLSRVDIGPVLLFVYGFLSPLVFYYAAYRLWPSGHVIAMSRVLVALMLLEFLVVAAVDLPSFIQTRNPDDISGTFGENAYQLVFFLIVAASLVAGIATFEHRRLAARFAPALIGASFLVIFLAQYRALLVTTALSAILVAVVLATVRGRGLLAGTIVVIACVLGLSYVATYFPVTKFSSTLSALRENPTSFVAQRLAPITRVSTLFAENPAFVATGTGPGTYSSRAWRTFARPDSGDRDPASNVASVLTGGRRYSTDVSTKYTLEQYRHGASVLGSRALQTPFSSYASLLAEVGLLGFILLIGMYAFAALQAGRMAVSSMRRRLPEDPLPALLLATAVAFFVLLQMAALENWLEVTRVTVPAWILLAIATREFEARRQAPLPEGLQS
jgi:hypothetical protein